MVFIAKRIFAQIIDLVVGFLILFAVFAFLVPALKGVLPNNWVRTILGLVVVVLAIYGVHYPFMVQGQTIGKAFFALRIVSTDKVRLDVPVAVVVQREVLCKLLSCYFICIPVLFKKLGGHEEATHTKVVNVRLVNANV